jgi:tRNA pseudouridine55 synthase
MFTDFRAGEVILINKPYQWTSFDAVNKVKWLLKKHPSVIPTGQEKKALLKVGHAGTLDPLATGLLIICTGKFTKRIDTFQSQEKEYTGTFCMGATTPCFDMEKEVDAHYPTAHITPELILQTAQKFIGVQQQTPPLFSAIKIDGKRAYTLAREGKSAEIKPKEITLSAFEITNVTLPYVEFRVVCSKGTYIRSLARDFGIALNSGAYLSALCRTRIGDFKLADALSIANFEREIGVESNKLAEGL